MLRNNDGFTLIELLIVITIIAILAAIAIPRFNEYRIKGFNSSATSDCRNTRSAEEAFYSDWKAYASSGANGVPGTALVLIDTANSTGPIAANSIDGTSAPSETIPAPGFSVGISNNVGVVVQTSLQGGSFSLGCKNAAGDRCFGLDSDSTTLYWINGASGSAITVASVPVPVSGANDYAPGGMGVAGAGVCSGNPAGAGQTIWAAL